MSYTHTYELHSHMCHTHTWTKLRCIIAFWRAPSLATPSYPPFFSPRHIYESYIPRYTYKSCINNAEPSWHFDEPTPSRLHPILSSFHRATYMNNIYATSHILIKYEQHVTPSCILTSPLLRASILSSPLCTLPHTWILYTILHMNHVWTPLLTMVAFWRAHSLVSPSSPIGTSATSSSASCVRPSEKVRVGE